MKIGVPRETKDMEFRVGMVPDGVRQLGAAAVEPALLGQLEQSLVRHRQVARLVDTGDEQAHPLSGIIRDEPGHDDHFHVRFIQD